MSGWWIMRRLGALILVGSMVPATPLRAGGETIAVAATGAPAVDLTVHVDQRQIGFDYTSTPAIEIPSPTCV